MNLIRKGHRRSHRGVIGVESAIVMIAFVIVAAALAFVVLNMGFSTTQKAKTTIIAGLGEASSSLEVAGKVTSIGCTTNTGAGCNTTPRLNVTAIPIKVSSGGDSINLQTSTASIKYLSNSVQYDNIYQCSLGTVSPYGYANVTTAFTTAVGQSACNNAATGIPFHPQTADSPLTTRAIIYWSVNSNNNSILDQGEHAVLAIAHGDPAGTLDERPASLDKIRTEIVIPTGAPLTVERQIPNITTLVVDMG
jgi:flagellin FlaB